VIGGGPAGTVFAYTAASHGKCVLMLEKNAVPSTKVCGGVLSPRCLRALDRAGLGEQVRRIPHQYLTFLDVELDSGDRLQIPFPKETTRVVDRCELDALLWRAAVTAGAEGWEQTIARSIGRSSDEHWTVLAQNSQETPLHGKLLIGADGRNSFVARQLALRAKGARRSFCLQYRLTRHDFDREGVHFFIFQNGYCGLSVDGTGMAHLDIISLKGREDEVTLNARLMEQKSRFVDRLRAAEYLPGKPVTRSPIGQGRRAAPSFSNVFLLGDAQGWVEPFTGEGISLAVESGHELAQQWATSQPIATKFPNPSMTNRCMGFVINKPHCTQALARLLKIAPRVGQWMSHEVLK